MTRPFPRCKSSEAAALLEIAGALRATLIAIASLVSFFVLLTLALCVDTDGGADAARDERSTTELARRYN